MGAFRCAIGKVGIFVAIVMMDLLTAQEPIAEKAPVPSAEVQSPFRKMAGEIYGDRYRDAKTPTEKSALAKEILQAALETKNGSPDQYVMLDIAKKMAVGIGDVATAFKAIDNQAQGFDVPLARRKAEVLISVAPKATTTAQHKAIAGTAAGIIRELELNYDYETAVKLCELAESEARKANLYSLANELVERVKQLREQEIASKEYREAIVILDKEPFDATANLTAGRYLCFIKGDWTAGLVNLMAGSDKALSDAATRDSKGAATAEEQVVMGDMWWTLAESREGEEKNALLSRAASWYRRAGSGLDGVNQLKVKKRLEEITALGREIPRVTGKSSSTPPLAVAPFDANKAKEYQTLWANYLKMPVFYTNSIGMIFALIPPGEFMMGSPEGEKGRVSDEEQHQVRITKPFYLGVYEVTQEQYKRVMGKNPSYFKGATLPVEQVSWNNAVEFCRKLSEKERWEYRLPTEAEWEYACRGGTTTPFSFGSVLNGDQANCDGDYPYGTTTKGPYKKTTVPVGSYRPNSFELYDMHGNVFEWCMDWYDKDYYAISPVDDPSGPLAGFRRVRRGGSWRNDAWYCRSANCSAHAPGYGYFSLGFRLALVPEE